MLLKLEGFRPLNNINIVMLPIAFKLVSTQRLIIDGPGPNYFTAGLL